MQIAPVAYLFSVTKLSLYETQSSTGCAYFHAFHVLDIMIVFEVSNAQFLPPANEVWGKVIFPEVCVSHSVYGGRGGRQDIHGREGRGHACRRDGH